jgi:hypothetical protein
MTEKSESMGPDIPRRIFLATAAGSVAATALLPQRALAQGAEQGGTPPPRPSRAPIGDVWPSQVP